MNYKELEKKVKSMTAHDIIMAMVDGLRNPRTKINMRTFGEIREGTCFGCAATNAILHIMEANKEEVEGHILARGIVSSCPLAVYMFEIAIDFLRCGRVAPYNSYAMNFGFAQITHRPWLGLPPLEDDYTEEQLKEYEKLAKYQLTVKQ